MGQLEKLEELKNLLKIDQKKKEISEIETSMQEPDFWLDESKSNPASKKLKNLKDEIKEFEDLYEIAQIANEEELAALQSEIEKLEFLTLFSGKYDEHNAIINFYAGAGGDDAQDWTEMLLTMYLKYAQESDYDANVIAESRGGEAGIKSATVEIKGIYAYGRLKGENGVHRLVRQSPFNAKALRQTSFALVQVLPEVEAESEVAINPGDLRVDVYRSGGHGGQSVNTTDSAIRITHLPTGIVVTCQNERSQLQNKEMAMKVLRSRLAQLMIEQHKERVDELKGDFSAPEWGNQIRSYVLHPYKLVKDHRTDFESTNPQTVLNGGLEGFIEAELKAVSSKQ
ncbi:MAG: peptide chain release factor 2 [Candidatus Berkelbacteria bacterium]|nr:peptide chain release factor 2 [Candidatus Berkelbacteria bacterium]